jgi:sigma-E factor negative regulatory protein RseA
MADKTAEQRSAPVEDDANFAASQLSAIIDDELDDREIELVLRRLGRDRDSRVRWERYHLISDAMQGHLPDAFDAGFATRLRDAIEAEPPLRPITKPLPAWYKPVTGFGLAASVVLVALFGLKQTQPDGVFPAISSSQVAVAPAASSAIFRSPQFATGIRSAENREDPVEVRLTPYLANHSNVASRNSVPVMPHSVRMVGYQIGR